jgi:hypothetical protein
MCKVSKNTSRFLAKVEVLLIAAPILVLSLFGIMFLEVAALSSGDPASRNLFIASALLAPVACACCGLLLLVLIFRGSAGLRAAPVWLWLGLVAGVLIALAGVGSNIGQAVQLVDYRGDFARFGVFLPGVFMLLPVLHLALERRRK